MPSPDIDVDRPSAARVYDYVLGGKDNYAVDRQAAEQLFEIAPEIRDTARENRAFLRRMVRYLAGEGVRQFLDLGAGLPTVENTHQVAQAAAPDTKTVYVDNDPIVLAHGRAYLDLDARTSFLSSDIRDTAAVLDGAGAHLDLSEPIGLFFVNVLHLVGDRDDPAGLVAAYAHALAPGSHVVITHVSSDGASEELRARIGSVFAGSSADARLRTREEIRGMFGGLPLLEPGLVDVAAWRPEDGDEPVGELRVFAGVARVQ
ncbi:SAM-dependent methyltransferase [Actinomadura sp. WMMA1423]|uniref:SAM-dependent methyltransferase n=1 Tax=Actinomadura sp. WMMA1423 TaxID=2591108 RepID=UPI001146D281|nr:SAM-dependent methyltransferase [Actinomadura sp. WMMA1423]